MARFLLKTFPIVSMQDFVYSSIVTLHRAFEQDNPGTSQDSPGTSQDCPGTSQDSPGTSQGSPGTSQDSPGTSQDCSRTSWGSREKPEVRLRRFLRSRYVALFFHPSWYRIRVAPLNESRRVTMSRCCQGHVVCPDMATAHK